MIGPQGPIKTYKKCKQTYNFFALLCVVTDIHCGIIVDNIHVIVLVADNMDVIDLVVADVDGDINPYCN